MTRRVRLVRMVRSLFRGQVGCGRVTDDIPDGTITLVTTRIAHLG